MTKIFLADTYALIEIMGGNLNYKPYLSHIIITTKYCLVELYYYFLRNYDKKTADNALQVYSDRLVPITSISIQVGMEFKLQHKKEKLSYIDCLGYALSLELGVAFLTGDEKFEHKTNVEFVK